MHVAALVDAKLAHAGFTPAVHCTIVGDSERIEGSSGNADYVLLVEVLNIGRDGSQLNGLGKTQLAFVAAAPGIQVALICQYERVTFAARNLYDALFFQRFEYLRRLDGV